MKKRTAVIGALVALLPMGQTLVMGTGASLTSAVVLLSVPERARAESEEFYFKRAYKKAEEGDHYGAISDYSKAIKINPRNSKSYYNRGISKGKSGDNYGAISDYNKAIEINPRYAKAYYNRGNAKNNLKDYLGAITDYNMAIEIYPRYSYAYNNRGVAKYLSGDFQGACSDARKGKLLGYSKASKALDLLCQ